MEYARIAIGTGSRYCVSMMPTARPDDALATWRFSMTVTSRTPSSWSSNAVQRPIAPAPTTTTPGCSLMAASLQEPGGSLAT